MTGGSTPYICKMFIGKTPESIIRVSDFHLQDFRTGASSPFAMQLDYEALTLTQSSLPQTSQAA